MIKARPFLQCHLRQTVNVRFKLRISQNRKRSAIHGDPGADSGDEGKSKRAKKCGAKKSKERREEPLGTMSYQTSSKRSPPSWLLIGARKLVFALFSSFFIFLRSIYIFLSVSTFLRPLYLPLGLRG